MNERIVPKLSEKVKLALLLDKQSCHHQIEMTPDEALAFVSEADAYNAFSKEDLIKLITKINDVVPRMNFAGGGYNGQPNPNNGRTFHTFSIGNEGSRVIYLKLIRTYLTGNNAKPDFVLKMISAIKSAAQTAHADENSHEITTWTIEFRFWWD